MWNPVELRAIDGTGQLGIERRTRHEDLEEKTMRHEERDYDSRKTLGYY